MRWIAKLLPSRASIAAALAAALGLVLILVRRDARLDQKRNSQIEDFEHAQDIADAVARDRADPDRLRPYEGRGYRD